MSTIRETMRIYEDAKAELEAAETDATNPLEQAFISIARNIVALSTRCDLAEAAAKLKGSKIERLDANIDKLDTQLSHMRDYIVADDGGHVKRLEALEARFGGYCSVCKCLRAPLSAREEGE